MTHHPANENKNVWIIDSTLRDGEQAPGVVFTDKEKRTIAAMLQEIGVDEIEGGIPAMGDDMCRTIKELSRIAPKLRVTSWCRAAEKDIFLAATCDTGSVHISFPVSAVLLKAFNKTPDWVLGEMERLIPVARRYFDFVSVGIQDATRCATDTVAQSASSAYALGADRVVIADTIGIARPQTIDSLIGAITKPESASLAFHGHNDLGMATANTISAVDAGADAVSVTVNGVGERAGNARLEEVAMALELGRNSPSAIDHPALQSLCSYVAELTNRPIAPDKPITGSGIFKHESGIHCRALLDDSTAYQPFNPTDVGRAGAEFCIGQYSGAAAVKYVLERAGVTVDTETAGTILPLIRKKTVLAKRSLTVDELVAMVS